MTGVIRFVSALFYIENDLDDQNPKRKKRNIRLTVEDGKRCDQHAQHGGGNVQKAAVLVPDILQYDLGSAEQRDESKKHEVNGAAPGRGQ